MGRLFRLDRMDRMGRLNGLRRLGRLADPRNFSEREIPLGAENRAGLLKGIPPINGLCKSTHETADGIHPV